MQKFYTALFLVFLISSCANVNNTNPVMPRHLVTSSVEKISFPITDKSSIVNIEEWIKSGDKPSQAELSCPTAHDVCEKVKALLKRKNIKVKQMDIMADSGNVTLIYSHIVAKDCSLNDFGCSTAKNAIGMVTNREQFVNPAISDYQDAARAVKAVREYAK